MGSLTGDKTFEQLQRELDNTPWTIERQAIVEPDYRLESLKAASKLPNKDLAELLTNADRIEKWLNEPNVIAAETKRRNWEEQKKIIEKLSENL